MVGVTVSGACHSHHPRHNPFLSSTWREILPTEIPKRVSKLIACHLGWAFQVLLPEFTTLWCVPVYSTSLGSEQSEQYFLLNRNFIKCQQNIHVCMNKTGASWLLNLALGITLRNQRDQVSSAWSSQKFLEVSPPKLLLNCNPKNNEWVGILLA